MIKHEPEVRRAKGKGYVAWYNAAVHDAPWTKGEMTAPEAPAPISEEEKPAADCSSRRTKAVAYPQWPGR